MRLGSAFQLILVLILASSAVRSDDTAAEYLGSFRWEEPRDWFGGLSGIELSDDGMQMVAITDRGRIVKARIARRNGRIEDIKRVRSFHLRGYNGAPLIGKIVDAEGLAVAPDGSLFISFERVHRVSKYTEPRSDSKGLHRPKAFRDLPYNGGFEALAIDRAGRLFAVPEDVLDAEGNIPVFRWQEGTWSQPFNLPGDGRFLPVGADFGPDDRLYVLERSFSIFGFRTRVRSWRVTNTGAFDEQIELETKTGEHDNLEGLTVWRDRAGRLRLTMIADDNFFFLQDTELVEYALNR